MYLKKKRKEILKSESATQKIKQCERMESNSRKCLSAVKEGLLEEETYELRPEREEKVSRVRIGGKHLFQPKHTPIEFPSYALFNLFFFCPR